MARRRGLRGSPVIILTPISMEKAKEYFEKHSAFRGEFNLAIAAKDEAGTVHGVIALTADGETFKKEQISTDGSAFIGSLLYGSAWRAAAGLGYKSVIL
jgi:acetoacetate decarboxylase